MNADFWRAYLVSGKNVEPNAVPNIAQNVTLKNMVLNVMLNVMSNVAQNIAPNARKFDTFFLNNNLQLIDRLS